MRRPLLAVALAALSLCPAQAATRDTHSGWAAWFNTTRLSERWLLVWDFQLRSADGWERVRNGLARGGLSYSITPSLSAALGYAQVETYTPGKPDLTEQRIWQQLLHQQPLFGGTLSQRLRLEQRFVERAAASEAYSDRLRYSIRLQLPLFGDRTLPFTQGAYAVLQDEAFVGLGGYRALNGTRFDQNRAWLALGFRLTPGLDVEAGYLHQYLSTRGPDTENHIVQLAIQTRF